MLLEDPPIVRIEGTHHVGGVVVEKHIWLLDHWVTPISCKESRNARKA
jgi:hypothetical protein